MSKNTITIYQGDNDESSLGDTSEMTEDEVAQAFLDIHAIERKTIKSRFGNTYKLDFDSSRAAAPGGFCRVAVYNPNDEEIIPEIEQAFADAFDEWCSK